MQSISFSSFLALLHTSEILQTTATHVTGKAWSSFCYVASQIKSTSEDSWYDQIWSSPSRTHLKNNQKRGGQPYTQWAKTRKKVHFGRTMYCLPQRLKSMCFDIFSSGGSWKRGHGVKKIFQKTLILVFEAKNALSFQNGLFSVF